MSLHVFVFMHECAFAHVPGCACTCAIVKVRASVRLSVRVSARSICKIVVTSNLCSHVALHYMYRSSLALVTIVLISTCNIQTVKNGYANDRVSEGMHVFAVHILVRRYDSC